MMCLDAVAFCLFAKQLLCPEPPLGRLPRTHTACYSFIILSSIHSSIYFFIDVTAFGQWRESWLHCILLPLFLTNPDLLCQFFDALYWFLFYFVCLFVCWRVCMRACVRTCVCVCVIVSLISWICPISFMPGHLIVLLFKCKLWTHQASKAFRRKSKKCAEESLQCVKMRINYLDATEPELDKRNTLGQYFLVLNLALHFINIHEATQRHTHNTTCLSVFLAHSTNQLASTAIDLHPDC